MKLQIQSVIYGNQVDALVKAMKALQQAVKVYHRRVGDLQVRLIYGDSTPTPVLDEKTQKDIREMLKAEIEFEYKVFGFNSGTAKGHNLMAENTDADIMMIMNPDVILEPTCLCKLMEPLKLKEVGMVEARQTPLEHAKEYNTKTGETEWASTACTVFKTEVYNKINGFDAETCGVLTAIDEQSADIAMGVDRALEAKEHNLSDEEIEAIGAGDQGMMYGYATNETKTYMPYPIELAHKLALQLTKVRKDGILPYLRPDGKTQVTVEYDEKDKPFRLDAVVLSTQHDPDITQEQIQLDIKKYVFDEILPGEMVDENTKFYINPTGRFVIGGPHGDSGLTGRKIIVDTYGGYARHGGGAFSGKDCTKVDRSASYAARYAAKNIVASGLAEKCEVQLSYAIGVAQKTGGRRKRASG